MTPLISRLICSMAVCPLDTSTNDCALQFGQSSQPSPLPGQPDDPAGYDQQAQTAGGESGDQPELAHAQGPAIHVPSRI